MEISILGNTRIYELEKRIKMVAAAGKLSRFKGNVFDVYDSCNNYEKNLKFIEKVIGMGHKSIVEHDYLVIALKNVSPIVEQTLIEERFSSFTIKSRREVNFENAGYYTPNFYDNAGKIFENNKTLQEQYKEHMEYLFGVYKELIDLEIPKEDARYILPYSFNSNIIMGVDAHTLNRMILKLKTNSIEELRIVGNQLANIVSNEVPYLSNELYKNYNTIESIESLIPKKVKQNKVDIKSINNVKLLSATDNIDETIIASLLCELYGIDYNKAKEIYNNEFKNNSELTDSIIKKLYTTIDKNALKQVNFRFQIPISLAALTHITRHRTHDMIIPSFVPNNNLLDYVEPQTIHCLNPKLCRNVFKHNYSVYKSFKNQGISETNLPYFHLAGNKINIITSMSGETLAHILHLRTCNKAQWEIKNIAQQMQNLVSNRCNSFSKILGPDCEVLGICPEKGESCKLKKIKK